jgi:peptide/nickel transport system ATP-binding protein
MSETLLEVRNLKKYFKTAKGFLHAVDNVSLRVERGKTLGVVGESGCGKSTLGRAILRLLDITEGEVYFEGTDITRLPPAQMRYLRKEMQIIFQDPYSSLDPRKTVSQIISAPIRLHKIAVGKKQIEAEVHRLMELVGLAPRLVNAYPHELDGGRRQRIGIARALAVNPKFIVCDEPVSALDVSIQAQILNLMKELQKRLGLTYMFISHDLSVINYFSDDIVVMYLGKVVETAPAQELFDRPMHPYTRALLAAKPVPELHEKKEAILLKGEITSPINLPDECRFANRCDYACAECRLRDPTLTAIEPGHQVACRMVTEKYNGIVNQDKKPEVRIAGNR